jgi:hypothetical protein
MAATATRRQLLGAGNLTRSSHLLDEDPDGAAAEVCYGMARLWHRRGPDRDEPVPPGTTWPTRRWSP